MMTAPVRMTTLPRCLQASEDECAACLVPPRHDPTFRAVGIKAAHANKVLFFRARFGRVAKPHARPAAAVLVDELDAGDPGASSLGSDFRKGLQDHPTVKPTAMLEDALIDLTNRGDIVLDPFLGSGSTLMAAEKTGRICCGLELDPRYVDVIIRRYETATRTTATLAETGETFATVAARRRNATGDEH
jgi:DNA methylase